MTIRPECHRCKHLRPARIGGRRVYTCSDNRDLRPADHTCYGLQHGDMAGFVDGLGILRCIACWNAGEVVPVGESGPYPSAVARGTEPHCSEACESCGEVLCP